MRRRSTTAWSLWAWFTFGVLVLAWLPAMAVVRLVTWPFDRGRYWTGYLFRKLPVVHRHTHPLWDFRITGDLPSDPRHPYVVVSNHESFVDILLISHLPWEMKWLSKKEMFRIPVAGWLMRLAGDIPIERGTGRDAAVAAIAACRERLDRRVSVMIFPEGTRSRTGEMLPFKDGAFRLAIEAGVPILPLALTGTAAGLRKDSWRFGRTTATLRVLAPLPTDGLKLDDLETLKDDTRRRIEAGLADLRA